jgi:uncharacterized protein (DUF4415 family)
MSIVSYTLEELKQQPSLTDWERVLNMADEDVVVDDENPAWTDEDFARATLRTVPAEQPQRISIYVRPSLLARYRSTGKGWRTRLSDNFETFLSLQQKYNTDIVAPAVV